MDALIANSLLKAQTYAQYRETVTALLAEGKATGNVQSDALVHYSQLNETRMNRLQKTVQLEDAVATKLQHLTHSYTWLVLSEGWCGDAAQLLPVMHKMALASDKIELKIVFRDQHPELMDAYLTNGTRSIPKLLILDNETKTVVATWGPRPEPAAQLVRDYKAAHGVFDEAGKTDLQLWYLHDKGTSTQEEIAALLR
ncbi:MULTISPECIES: thioredoxin family protein [unclassified Flavobacterium]|uniref:thioredoxin family protein n=1 Tax=unclassified Flavobacterium TaxID=196869 RepID=UPI001F149045|nr:MULTISPECIES: thioredoxin family protein [unclassified Flavobacterium]UMY66646.1 thioredoxin family protein [Flavobacterium sp. HJ-32-4]